MIGGEVKDQILWKRSVELVANRVGRRAERVIFVGLETVWQRHVIDAVLVHRLTELGVTAVTLPRIVVVATAGEIGHHFEVGSDDLVQHRRAKEQRNGAQRIAAFGRLGGRFAGAEVECFASDRGAAHAEKLELGEGPKRQRILRFDTFFRTGRRPNPRFYPKDDARVQGEFAFWREGKGVVAVFVLLDVGRDALVAFGEVNVFAERDGCHILIEGQTNDRRTWARPGVEPGVGDLWSLGHKAVSDGFGETDPIHRFDPEFDANAVARR